VLPHGNGLSRRYEWGGTRSCFVAGSGRKKVDVLWCEAASLEPIGVPRSRDGWTPLSRCALTLKEGVHASQLGMAVDEG
jgi:hypothetical protein